MSWAGTDEWIEDDVQIDGRGDIATLTDEMNVDSAVVRRLNTAKGDLFYDPNYGNRIHDKLSDPITERWLTEAAEDIRECLSWESRIKVQSVDVTADPENRLVRFHIRYEYANGKAGGVMWEVRTD